MQGKGELFSSCILAANHSPGTKKGRKKINHSISLQKQVSSPSSSEATGQEGAASTTKKDHVAFLPHFLIMSGKKFWISEACWDHCLEEDKELLPESRQVWSKSAEKLLVTEQQAAKLDDKA